MIPPRLILYLHTQCIVKSDLCHLSEESDARLTLKELITTISSEPASPRQEVILLMKRFILIVVFLCSLEYMPAMATIYLVGPSRPYSSLQAVTGLLLPGDTVLVDGDHTYPGGVNFTQPGAIDAPITIRGIRINGNRPVISGGANTVQFSTPWPYTGPGADHYIFEGFEITGGTSRGIYHQAADLVVRDTLVHDCPQHGILGADGGSGSLTLEHVEVYACGSGDTRHQIYMATDETNRPPGSVFRMQFCYIHDGNGGNNVKSRAERNEIYYNWIEGAYYHELELIGPDGQDPELAREDSDVVGNVLWKRNDFAVIRVGGDGTGETFGRYRFVNNTIIAGSGVVFRIFDGIESIEMHNNVLYREGTGAVAVMRTVEADWLHGEVIGGSHNWLKNGATTIPSQWTGTIFGTDPLFDDISANSLNPSASSPLVDSGDFTLESPPRYPFPSPLFPPHYVPGHSAGLIGSEQTRLIFNQIDIGAYERSDDLLCVDDSNQTGTEDGTSLHPFSTIQDALDASSDGFLICIAQGDYLENIQINDRQVGLFGGFEGGDPSDYASGTGGSFTSQNPDLWIARILASPSASAVEFLYTGASGSTIDGLTISGGDRGIELDDDLTWPELTGMTIRRTIIESNGPSGSTSHRGGGMYLSGSSHRVDSNTIRSNRSGRGAGIYSTAADCVISGNRIESNVAYDDHAGGLNLSGSVHLTGNTIIDNRTGEGLGYGWGGGVLILGTAWLSGNVISGNHAPSIGGAVFVDEGGWAELRNELIYGNTTQAHDKGGAAVYVDGGAGPSHADIINCTITDNTSPGSTGGNGIYVEGNSSASAVNSIFSGNGTDDFYVSGDSTLTVRYSLSQESVTGTGNFSADPLFADPSNADYHLKSMQGRWDPAAAGGIGSWVTDSVHSPAIDAGDPGSSYGSETEPNGDRINLGVFGNTEFASRSFEMTPVPSNSPVGVFVILFVISALVLGSSRFDR